jgi:hypothetical protein
MVLSTKGGQVEQEARVEVGVAWEKAPAGLAKGTVTISQGDRTVTVGVEVFKPAELQPSQVDGFVESEGVVSMEAEHFTGRAPGKGAGWVAVDGYGRTLSGMTVMPMTAASTKPGEGPMLEYKFHAFDAGKVTLQAIVGPSLNVLPDRGLRLAVAMDDEAPQEMTILPQGFNAQNGNRAWEQSVKDNARVVSTTHTLAAAGDHVLKVWAVDPGVVLEKFVVDFGGQKKSYLGPPESFRNNRGH